MYGNILDSTKKMKICHQSNQILRWIKVFARFARKNTKIQEIPQISSHTYLESIRTRSARDYKYKVGMARRLGSARQGCGFYTRPQNNAEGAVTAGLVSPKPQSKQTKMTTFTSTGATVQTKLGPEKKKQIDEALNRLIVGKILPPSLVENQYFKEFVSALDSRYQLPCRSTVMERLEKKQEEVEHKIKDELRGVEGVGITHDGWTSNATESYNTTTVHYIKDWKLKSAVLNTHKMEGSHTGEKIAQSLLETKVKWGLPEQLVATTDNAANEKKAFEILKWNRFGCYGHRINLIVKNAMAIPELAKIQGKSRRLVTLFHTSSSVNTSLENKQKLLLPDKLQGHKLISDVPTRWNSTLDMLARIIEQLPALMAVATDEAISKSSRTTIQNCLPTFEETTLAEKMVEVLQPFKKGTETLCAEKNPTIHKVLPVVMKLERALVENEHDPAGVKALKMKMRDQLSERAEAEDVALLGYILNPYTKGFEHLPTEKERAQKVLMLAMKAINVKVHVAVKKEKDENQNETMPELPKLPDFENPEPVQDLDQNANVINEPVTKKLKSADTEDWLDDVMCVGESVAEKEDVLHNEVNRYMTIQLKKDEKSVTVLEWWEQNELYFPRIAALAKRMLCIQASSVSSERVFSLAGGLVSKKRSRMSPANVDMFIFLNKSLGKFW